MAIYTGKAININMELMGGPDLGAIKQYLLRGYWVHRGVILYSHSSVRGKLAAYRRGPVI